VGQAVGFAQIQQAAAAVSDFHQTGSITRAARQE